MVSVETIDTLKKALQRLQLEKKNWYKLKDEMCDRLNQDCEHCPVGCVCGRIEIAIEETERAIFRYDGIAQLGNRKAKEKGIAE